MAINAINNKATMGFLANSLNETPTPGTAILFLVVMKVNMFKIR